MLDMKLRSDGVSDEIYKAAMLEQKEPLPNSSYQAVIVKKQNNQPTTRVELHKPKTKEEIKPLNMVKELSVVESDPFQEVPIRRFLTLTEQERIDVKTGNPELNVRLAGKEEQIEQLSISEDAMTETNVIAQNVTNDSSDYKRYKVYEEAMEWVYELAYKLWILNNSELLLMPDFKILRWKW